MPGKAEISEKARCTHQYMSILSRFPTPHRAAGVNFNTLLGNRRRAIKAESITQLLRTANVTNTGMRRGRAMHEPWPKLDVVILWGRLGGRVIRCKFPLSLVGGCISYQRFTANTPSPINSAVKPARRKRCATSFGTSRPLVNLFGVPV